MDSPTTPQRQRQPPTLLDGILDGNGTELAFLLRAVLQLIKMHHGDNISERVCTDYRQLANLSKQLHGGQVEWIDQDDPGLPNPDAKAIRSMVFATARVTLLKALIHCVAVQRRYVTGTIYGPGTDPQLQQQAKANRRVRWVQYQPWPETDVEALIAYVHDYEQLSVAGVNETLEAALQWRREVIPDLRRHYRTLTWKYGIHPYIHQARSRTSDASAKCRQSHCVQRE